MQCGKMKDRNTEGVRVLDREDSGEWDKEMREEEARSDGKDCKGSDLVHQGWEAEGKEGPQGWCQVWWG